MCCCARGAGPIPTRDNEVLINEAFAEANLLAPGMQLRALIYGRHRELEIVGIASSPEFVFAVAPGAMLPEPERFGVVWMGREALGRAFDRRRRVQRCRVPPRARRGCSRHDLRHRCAARAARRPRRLRARPDAVGAVPGGRADIAADDGLDPAADLPAGRGVPAERLAVAAGRDRALEHRPAQVVRLRQRRHRASTTASSRSCSRCSALRSACSSVASSAATWPRSTRRSIASRSWRSTRSCSVYLWAVVVALIAAVLGAAQAVLRAARLPPAAALAPPAPVGFSRLGQGIENAARNLDGKTRMVARRIARFPRRSATTVVGITLALALLITSQHFPISMNHIVDVTFGVAQRMDATLTFAETADDRILAEVGRLPGVYSVEPLRATEVILTAGSRQRRDTLMGLTAGRLSVSRARSEHERACTCGRTASRCSHNLANKLGVKVGDTVRVQATDGHRAHRRSDGRRSREAVSRRRRVHGAGRAQSRAARAGARECGLRADGPQRARRAQSRSEGDCR